LSGRRDCRKERKSPGRKLPERKLPERKLPERKSQEQRKVSKSPERKRL
jgi:hypothetical protein